ncbi:MYO1A (predicted) [Pycnogonum litorale]
MSRRDRIPAKTSDAKGVLSLDQEIGFSDAVVLHPLSEEAFIANLHQRYKRDLIYTYIGSVLVSVNPYKVLALYTPAIIDAYKTFNRFELPPHIYAIADDSYCSMKNRNINQCIVISGESGSGKTEASKLIMQYVGAVSGKSKEVLQINNQLVESNPVLEAFGNAKTHRNDNSSRFGKYMDMEFDFKGDPVGGVITNYLLEKSRVTNCPEGERNFHIFYQLLTGSDIQFLKTLKLQRNIDHYRILSVSKCSQIENIDDRTNYVAMRKALSVIGFSQSEVLSVFQLISTVLKLGNLEFRPHANMDGTEGCVILNEYELHDVCEIIKSDFAQLHSSLVQRTIDTKHDFIVADLTASEAANARDSLCKAIYNRLFSWLVNRINESVKPIRRGRLKCLGVLDIYGFEIFQKNGFEQFVINYCNEKLQQLFVKLTLKDEQEEYIKENIEWEHINYVDNSHICDLIEKNNLGLFSLLDDECLRPGAASDETLLEKFDVAYEDHAHYESRGCKHCVSDGTLPVDSFRLKHYAGIVTYSTVGFLEKNSDLFYRDLSQAMYQCQHELLSSLFLEGNPKKMTLKRPATAVTQFKISISALIKNLQSKHVNYIRCIKPNEMKQPRIFERALVQHQVKYLGLMENIRVKRAGYCHKQTYESFLRRYKMLCVVTWPFWDGQPAEGVNYLLRELPIHPSEYAFGRTKIFIKNPHTVYELEEFRNARLDDLATLIQKTFRGWKQRNEFMRIKWGQIIIAKYSRAWLARRNFLKTKEAIKVFRKFYFGWKARMLARHLRHQKKISWAILIIQSYYRGWKKRSYLWSLSQNLPSESPTCTDWPPAPKSLQQTSSLLQNLYHKWRCYKYKQKFDIVSRNRMREKVTASLIFKSRKSCYPKTVSHPFRGDYVRLRQNIKWKKMSVETHDEYVVFADILNKVTRTNGKCVPTLLVVSTSSMLVMDQRTLQIKYRVPASEIFRISLSPFSDDIAVIHVQPTEVVKCKGDFVFQTGHVIEVVTKMFLVVQNAVGKPPEIQISPEFEANFGTQNVILNFRSVGSSGGSGIDSQPGQLRITRKGNRLEVCS